MNKERENIKKGKVEDNQKDPNEDYNYIDQRFNETI